MGGEDVHCGCVIIVGFVVFSGRSEVTLWCVVFEIGGFGVVECSVCLLFVLCCVLVFVFATLTAVG